MFRARKSFHQKKKFTGRPRSDVHSRPQGPHSKHQGDAETRGTGVAVFVEGVLQRKGRVGFVLSETPNVPDVIVQDPSLRLAMDGDRVQVRLTSDPKAPRRAGDIVKVLTRARETMVGTFRRMGNLPVLAPADEGPLVHLTDLQSFVPHVGDIVTARILTWPTAKDAATGVLKEVLGPRDAPGVDLQSLIRQFELPDAFPPEVIAEADALGSEVPESAWKGRETFFHQHVVTIDGEDAKDFDDAVSIERTPDGWRLGVHIADVAHYVRENSPLDVEARRRGTSVYLSGTVLPMLPFPLSDNLCSLRPEQVRLTLSCIMEINREGEVTDARIVESAIRSARRFTYEEVEAILKRGATDLASPEITADIHEMDTLATLLRKKRFGRGSLDFDFPEPEVEVDVKGRPTDIQRRERLESHRLIEDFMLLANESVARHMQEKPFLYRIHETPDPAKLEKLRKSIEVVGLAIPRHLDPTHPAALQHIIQQSKGIPNEAMVHLMVLRSLRQAAYSAVNKGHYGLASKCYTHFTSPIRRYPDLIVHRVVKEHLQGRYREDWWKTELPAIALHTSRRERVAVQAERDYLDIQKVRLMESHVGEEFTGIISSVTNFGFFVQLDSFFVEGLVHVTSLGNDFFVFDEAAMLLRGRRSGRVFTIGQKVKIRLAAANVTKHQLDFQLVCAEHAAHSAPRSAKTPHPPSAHSAKHAHRRHRRRVRSGKSTPP